MQMCKLFHCVYTSTQRFILALSAFLTFFQQFVLPEHIYQTPTQPNTTLKRESNNRYSSGGGVTPFTDLKDFSNLLKPVQAIVLPLLDAAVMANAENIGLT